MENPSHQQRKKKKKRIGKNKVRSGSLTKKDQVHKIRNGVLKRSSLKNASSSRHDFQHHQPIHKRSRHLRLQDEEDYETMESFSPHPTIRNQFEEEHLEQQEHEDDIETETSDIQQDENIGSTTHGTTVTRGESRALTENRKNRLNKGKLVFEVDECAGRIVGEDSQIFITKGGCVMRKNAKFDGTTWKKQSPSLKIDIISKCMENSNYDPNCRIMVNAIQTQLGSQHRSKQYRLHKHYKSFPTKEEATTHPPTGIKVADWVNLCERFASENFQKISIQNIKNRSVNEIPPAIGTVSIARLVDMKRRKGEQVTAIDRFEIAHYSKRKKQMINDKAYEILSDLRTEESTSSCTPAEICLKKLNRIPGHIKGRSASTKQNLETENLRMELQLEKEKSKALEEKSKVLEEKVEVITEDHNNMKEQLDYMMKVIARFTGVQSQKNCEGA